MTWASPEIRTTAFRAAFIWVTDSIANVQTLKDAGINVLLVKTGTADSNLTAMDDWITEAASVGDISIYAVLNIFRDDRTKAQALEGASDVSSDHAWGRSGFINALATLEAKSGLVGILLDQELYTPTVDDYHIMDDTAPDETEGAQDAASTRLASVTKVIGLLNYDTSWFSWAVLNGMAEVYDSPLLLMEEPTYSQGVEDDLEEQHLELREEAPDAMLVPGFWVDRYIDGDTYYKFRPHHLRTWLAASDRRYNGYWLFSGDIPYPAAAITEITSANQDVDAYDVPKGVWRPVPV